MMSIKVPDAKLASEIARSFVGMPASSVRRFSTGARHYVYDVQFSDRQQLVVRIGDSTAKAEMAAAVHLSKKLRPLGVPLPKLLAEDVNSPLPWIILERLPGTDLGRVMTRLQSDQLHEVAKGVAAAQAATSQLASAGRFGFAVTPETAPHGSWFDVVVESFERSRLRIAEAGLFAPELSLPLEAAIVAHRQQLDEVTATPFLHDTTTRNVIVSSDGLLSGIVDVDDLCFGDARFAPALTLAVLLAYGGPTEYVDAWLTHSKAQRDALFELYVGLFLFDLMSEHGQTFNGNPMPSSPEERLKLERVFARFSSGLSSQR